LGRIRRVRRAADRDAQSVQADLEAIAAMAQTAAALISSTA
jgi:hypothetical protein